MNTLPLVLLAACAGPGTDAGHTGAEHNGLAVRLVAEDVPDSLTELDASIEQVVLEGEGPEGHAAVSYDARTDVAIVGGEHEEVPVVLDLPVGRWEGVRLTVVLGATDAGPALAAAGAVDGHRFELAVEPELELVGDGAFDLGSGVDPEVDVVLHPSEWLDTLGDEELDDEDGVVHLDLTHNRKAYDRLVSEIVDGTDFRFPGEEDGRDESR